MPDLACAYTLSTPGGTIIFNDDSVPDQYLISDIPQGLSQAPIRAPQDDLAYADGGNSYNFWKGARHILIEGNFLVTSVPPCPDMNARWNEMEDDLIAALESIAGLDTATGTLTWTPTGQLVPRSLIVRCEVNLETGPDQNYAAKTFHFGLLADDPTIT